MWRALKTFKFCMFSFEYKIVENFEIFGKLKRICGIFYASMDHHLASGSCLKYCFYAFGELLEIIMINFIKVFIFIIKKNKNSIC